MPTTDVHLRAHATAPSEPRDFFARVLYCPEELMPQGNRRFYTPLRPGVPVVNVEVCPADRSRFDAHEHVRGSHLGHRHRFEHQASPSLGLAKSLHRRSRTYGYRTRHTISVAPCWEFLITT